MQTSTVESDKQVAIERLSALCRGEISAVEIYDRVLHADPLHYCNDELRQSQSSHQTRVDLLRMQVGILGGGAPVLADGWAVVAKLVDKVASIAGAKAVLAILEQGEERGLELYRSQVGELDDSSGELLTQRLLPLQIETLRLVHGLRCAAAGS